LQAGERADAVGCDDEVGGGAVPVFKGYCAGFRVDGDCLLGYFEDAGWAVSVLFKGGFAELGVDVDAVEVVIFLSLLSCA
jgi:hypothetical protein